MYEYDHTIALQWDESSHRPTMRAALRRYIVTLSPFAHLRISNAPTMLMRNYQYQLPPVASEWQTHVYSSEFYCPEGDDVSVHPLTEPQSHRASVLISPHQFVTFVTPRCRIVASFHIFRSEVEVLCNEDAQDTTPSLQGG